MRDDYLWTFIDIWGYLWTFVDIYGLLSFLCLFYNYFRPTKKDFTIVNFTMLNNKSISNLIFHRHLFSSSTLDGKFLTVLRVVRLARIVRIAKLSRHSRNLNTLIKTFRQSLRELSFLMLFFIGKSSSVCASIYL